MARLSAGLSTDLRKVDSLDVGRLGHRPHTLRIAEEAVDVEAVGGHGQLLFLSVSGEQMHVNFVRQADVVLGVVLIACRICIGDEVAVFIVDGLLFDQPAGRVDDGDPILPPGIGVADGDQFQSALSSQ